MYYGAEFDAFNAHLNMDAGFGISLTILIFFNYFLIFSFSFGDQ